MAATDVWVTDLLWLRSHDGLRADFGSVWHMVYELCLAAFLAWGYDIHLAAQDLLGIGRTVAAVGIWRTLDEWQR